MKRKMKPVKATKAWCVDDPHFPLALEHVKVSKARAESHRKHGTTHGVFCKEARTIRVEIREVRK